MECTPFGERPESPGFSNMAASSTPYQGDRNRGYILSEALRGAWVAKKKQGPAPPDAGELDLEISGNTVLGYTLNGDVRSSSACSKFPQPDTTVRDLTGDFGRGIPAEWSAKVMLGPKEAGYEVSY
jgi:hypothetical protein